MKLNFFSYSYASFCYGDFLSLWSVLNIISEYYLITSILTVSIFFVLLPKVQLKHFNAEVNVFSFGSYQLNFLTILILVFYCFLSTKQYYLILCEVPSFNNSILNDYTSLFAKLIIGFSSIFYLVFIQQYLFDQKLNYFEYYILILTSILGFCLLCCSNDLLTAYLAIELQGLSFYVLSSFKKSSNYSVESGVKYFIIGSFSTIIFLFGTNLIYGISGTISLIDFKNLFIWVFSINSFFLTIEYFLETLKFFQLEKAFNNEDYRFSDTSSLITLRTTFDNLLILKTKTYTPLSDAFFFSNIVKEYFFCTEEYNLVEKIAKKMISIINDEDYCFFKNKVNNFQFTFSKSKEFIVFDALQNLSNWFFIDIQNSGVKFDGCNSLLECLFSMEYEIELLSKFNYNWITVSGEFELFSSSIMQNVFIKDWLEYSVFRYLSESKIMWLFEDRFNHLNVKEFLSNFNQKSEILSKSLNNIFFKENILNQYKNLKILPLFNNTQSYFISVHFNNNLVDSYLINLIHLSHLFPFFLEELENHTLTSSFTFNDSFINFGLLLILISLFLKLALTPFHLWSPDVYEGSPSSTTFFFIVVSKISIFVFLIKICYLSFYSLISGWQFYSIFVAVLSILLGSVAALKQRKLKSLLAYSSISNMGLILAAFSAGHLEGIKAVFYYFIIYIISGLSIWSIFLALKLKKKNANEKYNKDLGDFSLLHESNSILAYSFVIIMFTIAGIPPMVGFLAKINIFLTLIISSMNFIACISIVTSVISTFYYIRILKVIFFENMLIGKLFYPIDSRINIIRGFLFFLMVFFFVSPLIMDFFSYKIILFLNKNFT